MHGSSLGGGKGELKGRNDLIFDATSKDLSFIS